MSKTQQAAKPADDSTELLALKRKARSLLETGQPEEAEKLLQKAITLDPEAPDILHLLGRCAHACERYGQAIDFYNRTMQLADMAENYNAMAEAFITLRQSKEALKVIERAEALNVANYDSMVRKGFALLQENDIRNSLYTFMKAITQQPDQKDARVFISRAINPGLVPNYNEEFKTALVACLQSDDMEHHPLVQAWLQQIREDANAKSLLDLFDAKDYDSFVQLYAEPKNRRYALSPFFRLGMEKLVAMLEYYERFLKHIRRFYLETIYTNEEISAEEHSFLCSLAVYCFLGEYAMSISEEESTILEEIRARLESGEDPVYPEEIEIFAAYESLIGLKNADAIAANQALRRHEAGRLIKLQIDEPREEAKIKKTIERLVPIEDDISQAVQAMYEENPYPRWLSCNRICPLQDRHLSKRNIKILVAGCGTGRQPIQMACVFPRADILAVDLSSTSVAYAIRKAREYNIDNITFKQGDILNLGKALEPNSFDRVECAGVLHHMKDPMAGWRVITSLLKPGGVMTIGLYSEFSRQGIVKAREMIAEKGFPSTLEGIRACRDYIFTLPENDPVRKLSTWRDFYSVSDCRDMIFHVQEHRFTLLQIKECLDELGLEFRGFIGVKPDKVEAYRKLQPEGARPDDLAVWHRLEEENPDLFFSIYQFQAVKK